MISALVSGCGLWPTASALIAISMTRHDDPGKPKQQHAVGVVRLRMIADDARFAGAEQRQAGDEEQDRGHVERGHCRQRPPVEQAARDRERRSPASPGTPGSAAARSCCRWSAAFAMRRERNESASRVQ